MSTLKAICVYCGSGPGSNPKFVESARRFGRILAESNIGLIYGGGSIGLMGAIAEAVVDHGGRVTGIIPDFLKAREKMFRRAQEIIVTRDMHERKRLMFERADAFVALPGGIGTLEELVEQLTWAQLGRHKKPILIANVDGFWDPLCALFDHMRAMHFIRAGLSVSPVVVDRVEAILPALQDATRHVTEGEKEMTTVEPERL
ncbi:MAG: TIGR00730 family Rossman fold protein [Rhizobiales bacterium]|nr:TIGR00730 family Rossman fold protein [Hyphomicrobiales bacterium]